ncbi:efflux RND transporter periplasmic adaptor subunit [Danxiaibacter flavus]|uniref:Efflux RND transporter periplasmic adaptor subunit n=1 Tax=Danxiaibacter flavus TaxID=3049108 RepID=A0ABV3ZBJ1_9BACT|nr:efflux RND transporter periplasmic adaptor subunit [Chitinophagaceae bacterium DXS]
MKYLVISLMVLLAACNGRQHNHAEEKSVQAQEEIYTCPMHPQIIEHKPGKCPICGMDLVKKEFTSHEKVDVDLATLLKPTNSYVLSSIASTTIQKDQKELTIKALGSIDYDTRMVNVISSRVSGRIEKLYVKYRFQHVHKGDRVMDIYSPELVTAQQNLLFILNYDPENNNLIQAAKEKLLLLGMSAQQLQQLINTKKVIMSITVYSGYTGHIHEAGMMNESGTAAERMDLSKITEELAIKEGMYVEKGKAIFKIYNTDNSWAVLNVYAAEAPLVKTGMRVTVTPETDPSKSFDGTIGFIEPFFRKEDKTVTARVYFNNASLQIPIGSQVAASINVRSNEMDWLPKDAVLSLGLNKVVFLKEDGLFKVHPVQTGIGIKDFIQITGGLNATDSVAANAQYLMDSESFVKQGK